MQNWESLIAERKQLHPIAFSCKIEDPALRNTHAKRARYEHTEKRRARRFTGDYTLFLLGETIKTSLYTTRG